MTYYFKRIAPIAFAAIFLFSSCKESKTNTEEQVEITKMDSTSKAIKEATNKLEEQTKKVEASLEKLDKEFETSE